MGSAFGRKSLPAARRKLLVPRVARQGHQVIRATFYLNLSYKKCCFVSCDCLVRVLSSLSVLLGVFFKYKSPSFVIRTSNFGTSEVELACVSGVYIPPETKAKELNVLIFFLQFDPENILKTNVLICFLLWYFNKSIRT